MDENDQPSQGYETMLLVAQGVEELRNSLRVMLAAVEAEGFTPQEARAVVAGMHAAQYKN